MAMADLLEIVGALGASSRLASLTDRHSHQIDRWLQ